MVVTDEPMPDVAQPGSAAIWLMARKGRDVRYISAFGLEQFELAKRTAFSLASEYDEVLLLDAIMLYRAWRKPDA